MNGEFVAEATDASSSRTLGGIAEAPFLSIEEKVEALFLATLSRLPTADEQARFAGHVTATDNDEGQQQAFGDIFWALLNSSEFLMNH